KLVLLRPVPAGGHVVHRSMRGRQEKEQSSEQPFTDQEVIRFQAFVGRGVSVSWIKDEKLVEKSGSRAPVANDENRRIAKARAADRASQQGFLQQPQRAMNEANQRHDHGDVKT